MLKISKYIFVLLFSSATLPLCAQSDQKDTLNAPSRVRGIQFDSREAAAKAMRQKAIPLLSGMSVSADVVGAVMAAVSPYGQWEGAFRVHLKEKFFPIVEIGWGVSDHTDETSELHYKTHAPYFKIGCDYNFMKDKLSKNRIFGGLRYAFTSFKYDVDGPAIVDPVYGTETPFHFTDVSSNAQWMELVFGLEARVWRFLHLGWSFRYRFQTHEKKSSLGNSWYIPGYGKSGSTALGGTFNVTFDI